MPRSQLPLAALSLCCLAALAVPALAATVTETVSGTVSGTHTKDGQGLFGPAGASLRGRPFSLTFRYVPADFNNSGTCRTHACTYDTSTGTAAVGQSVQVTLTINGVTRTYAPTSIGAVFLSIQAPPFFALDSNAYSGFGGYGTGVQLYFLTISDPRFGAPLSPGNPPLLHHPETDYINFYDARSQQPIEQLNLNVRHTSA